MTLALARAAIRCTAAFAIAAMAACGDTRPLEPIAAADRVVLGEFGKVDPRSEIRDAQAVARALAFANELRAGPWSSRPVVHGSCGTVLLTFQERGKATGYLGLDGEVFYTGGPDGERQQAATRAAVDRFHALLPPRYETSKCMG